MRKITESRKIVLSNPEKIYWPKERYTKQDLLHCYQSVSSFILPFLKNRPMVLRRFPDGIERESFIQKNTRSLHLPDWIQTIEIKHQEKSLWYLLIQDEPSLEYAVNLGTIEFHSFHSHLGQLDYPDYFVLDLDPESVPLNTVIGVVMIIHQLFEEWKIPHYCKTSGGRGLHIYIPLHAKYSMDQVTKFGQILGILIHEQISKITSLERSPANRQGKIHLDVLQNPAKQTVVRPYSVRGHTQAPVSPPVHWEELKKGFDPQNFTIQTTISRLKDVGEIFSAILGKGFNMKQ